MKCPDCNIGDVIERRETFSFAYGTLTQLACVAPLLVCGDCKFSFTDWRYEDAQQRAVAQYLESLEPKVDDSRATVEGLLAEADYYENS